MKFRPNKHNWHIVGTMSLNCFNTIRWCVALTRLDIRLTVKFVTRP